MAYNRYCDTSKKVDRSSESNKIPLDFKNNWQKNSSQNHVHNGISLFNQEKLTKSWILRSHSGAIQVSQAVDTAYLSMIPERDPHLTTYLSELLRANKPEQQSNTFWFPKPENAGKTDDHTPIQKRIPKELNWLKKKDKLNPRDDVESRMKIFQRFDWTDTLLTETKKHAVENILVEYHDIFAGNRLDIGMNTEFKVRQTPKDYKDVYTQNLPFPIHLKEDLNVELALMLKYGIITVLPFSKYASPIFAQQKHNEILRLLVDLRKINTPIADD